jgi:hypothetical protein
MRVLIAALAIALLTVAAHALNKKTGRAGGARPAR